MKYPKISNYPSFDMLSGYQGQMAELDSIRVREMANKASAMIIAML